MDSLAGMKIHFMGAGGIGVSALALLALRAGASVTACDRYQSEMTEYLESMGIGVEIGHEASHVKGVDQLVYTSAVPPTHPERVAAAERGVDIRRGTFLARVLEGRQVLGVCGTHGKTTTTWLLAQFLIHAGLNPTVFLGGVPAGRKDNLIEGDPSLVVTELDESDGSFLEPFVKIGVVTNVEADHLDFYGSEEAVRAAFARFVSGISKDGWLIHSADGAGATEFPAGGPENQRSIGLTSSAQMHARILGSSMGRQQLELYHPTAGTLHATFSLPGEHNIRNLLAAFSAAEAAGAEVKDLLKAIPALTGVSRRFERIGEKRGVIVIDDYAHHPTEVEATLRAARTVHDGRVVAVFQPHLFSRTRFFQHEFAAALSLADAVYLVDIYPAREEPIPGVTSDLIGEGLKSIGAKAARDLAKSLPVGEVASHLASRVRSGDMVLFIGAGDIGGVARDFLAQL